VSILLWGDQEEDDYGKAKNIRQTELLVDLREAILQVARHFQSLDPKNNKVVSSRSTCRISGKNTFVNSELCENSNFMIGKVIFR